jgi:hypothetical protein
VLSDIKIIISKGLRLHFYLSVGYRGKHISLKPDNREQMVLHLIKDLKWRINLLNKRENCLYKESVELEADVDGELGEELTDALKALMRIRGLRRSELERLKTLPLREACRELVSKMLV